MNQESILIVDDEPEVRTLLGDYLQRKSKKVSSSGTLKDALAKFEKLKPQLLILDNNMPDGLGIDNIQKFKQIHSSSKVIVISALSNLKEQALKNGADYFLEKPISFSMLNELITNN